MSQEWKLPNTRFHKIMNLFSLLLLLGMFLYTAIKWPSLPQTIATHFNFMGEADGWGGKGNIWLMPVMSLLLYLLLTATTYFPGIWNVPVCMESLAPDSLMKVSNSSAESTRPASYSLSATDDEVSESSMVTVVSPEEDSSDVSAMVAVSLVSVAATSLAYCSG